MKRKTIEDINMLLQVTHQSEQKSFDFLYDVVGNLLDGMTVHHFVFKAEESLLKEVEKGYGCYRSRKVNSIKEISHEKHLWARESKDIHDLGRCNKIGQSILYCSNNFITTFAELGLNVGDICVTSRFTKKDKAELDHIPVISLGDDLTEYFSNPEYNPDNLTDARKKLCQKRRLKHDMIEQFINNSFRKKVLNDKDHYKITAAIVAYYLNSPEVKNIDLGGFFYPSVKADYGTYNIALNPEHAKKHMEINQIIAYQITNLTKDSFSFNTLNQVKEITSSGELIWEIP